MFSRCSDREFSNTDSESGWCVFAFLFFFYMGLNHYTGSLLNYRFLFPSKCHRAIFEALLCSTDWFCLPYFFLADVPVVCCLCNSEHGLWNRLDSINFVFAFPLEDHSASSDTLRRLHIFQFIKGMFFLNVFFIVFCHCCFLLHHRNNTGISICGVFVLPFNAGWALFSLTFDTQMHKHKCCFGPCRCPASSCIFVQMQWAKESLRICV